MKGKLISKSLYIDDLMHFSKIPNFYFLEFSYLDTCFHTLYICTYFVFFLSVVEYGQTI